MREEQKLYIVWTPRLLNLIGKFLIKIVSYNPHLTLLWFLTGLAALRQVCNSNPKTLQPYFAELVPSICYLVNSAPGPIKVMGEKTLAQVLNLNEEEGAVRSYLGSNPGGTVKSVLTEPFIRRLQKLSPDKEEEEEAY